MGKPNLTIPAIVKHMTIAIYRDGKISAKTKADRFKQCFMIAKSRCRQYGFVTFVGDGLTEAIGLTPKGRKREMHHQTHKRSSLTLFDTLYDEFDIDGSKAAALKKAQEDEAARLARAQEIRQATSKKDQIP